MQAGHRNLDDLEYPMLFRSIRIVTTMSLLSAAVSTTAYAGENAAAESDVAAAPETLPGAVLTEVPPRRPAPKAGPGRVAGEVLVGVGAGAGLAVGAALVAFPILSDADDSGWDGLGNAIGAVAIGGMVYPLGVGLGVGMVGNVGDVEGSYWAAIGGAYLGAAGGALLGWGLLSGEKEEGAIFLGYLVGAPLGAVIGHTLSLDWDKESTGLVHVSGSRARMSIPAVSVTTDPLHPQGTLMSIRLMDGRF
jgi:hypothetical protein